MSYAVHPARSVALKNGDCRYHGPKYSVALFASISSRSLTIEQPPENVRPASTPGFLLEAWFNGRPTCKSIDAVSSADALNEASGNRDLLRWIHERHRGHGGRPGPPFGSNRHGLTFAAVRRGEPAVADVLLQSWRVDRRRDR